MTGHELPMQAMSHSPTRYASVYVASKLLHAERIKALRAEWPLIYFTARWPVAASISFEQNRPAQHWIKDNLADIARSQFVVVLADEDDELKGAIWEVGYAYAYGITIYLVGRNKSYSKWQHAEGIRRRNTLEEVLKEISKTVRYPEVVGS